MRLRRSRRRASDLRAGVSPLRVGFVCEHGFKMKWSQLEPLRTLSGYDKKRLEPEYDFLHKLMRDVKAEEREGRGMNVNDKYHTAARISGAASRDSRRERAGT